jgi:O-antigen biosynthesis protein
MIPISVVIPSYNGLELLKESLPPILDSVDLNLGHEVIVVDDGSQDETISFLREHFPPIKVVAMGRNSGFAKASTEGILRSKNRMVALINNDVTVDQDFLSPMLRNFNENNVFAVGPKVIKKQGNSYYHLGSKAFFKKGEITIIRDREEKGETFYVSGGMAVFDKEKFLDLGGFDDLYHPFYWEDVDLCYRALKRGYRILYEPESLLYHKDQGTIVFSKKKGLELFFAKMRARIIQERNQYLFTWKNILDRGLISRHLMWIPIHLILSFRNKDHIFKSIGFLLALKSLPKALRKRGRERLEKYVLGDRQILRWRRF